MRIIIAAWCCMWMSLGAWAQTPQAIVAEGRMLYRSEAASWYGTDVFLEKLKNRSQSSGGYFSYADGKDAKCVFFSKEDMPKILAVVTFDSTYNPVAAHIDSMTRVFTQHESDLYTIRKKALEVINTDILFKRFKNTNFNVIPIIDKTKRRVYVLTGPAVSGVVVFGNDYQIDFDMRNNVIAKKRLHKNLIPMEYGKEKGQTAAMHSHLPSTGEYITATDICTLMLYEKYPGWKQYYVISSSYVSIWSCEKDELVVLTRKAWDRISADQKKRHPEQSKP